MHLFHIKMRIV